MFSTQNVALRLDDLTHRVAKTKSGDEVPIVDLLLLLSPLSPDLASELAEGVKGTLFKRSSAEVNPIIQRVEFAVDPRPQIVLVKTAPDLEDTHAALRLDRTELSKIVARKDKKTSTWALTFRLSYRQATGKELAMMQDLLYRQSFFSFEVAEKGLFDDEEGGEDAESDEAGE